MTERAYYVAGEALATGRFIVRNNAFARELRLAAAIVLELSDAQDFILRGQAVAVSFLSGTFNPYTLRSALSRVRKRMKRLEQKRIGEAATPIGGLRQAD